MVQWEEVVAAELVVLLELLLDGEHEVAGGGLVTVDDHFTNPSISAELDDGDGLLVGFVGVVVVVEMEVDRAAGEADDELWGPKTGCGGCEDDVDMGTNFRGWEGELEATLLVDIWNVDVEDVEEEAGVVWELLINT